MFEIECPSGLKFLARKFGGAELLAISERVSPNAMGDTIADVLRGCHIETIDAGPYGDTIASVGKAKPDFTRALFKDAWAALLHLRNKTFPQFAGTYRFEFHCDNPMCNALVDWTIPLDEVLSRVRPMPTSSYERIQANLPFESVVDGTRIKWDLARIAQQRPMREFMQKNQIKNDSALTQVCRQMKWLDGAKQQTIPVFWKWALGLDMDAIDALLYEMESAEAKVDTRVLVQCTDCRKQQRIQTPLGKAFFRPRLEILEVEMDRDDSSSESSMGSTSSSGETDSPRDTPMVA